MDFPDFVRVIKKAWNCRTSEEDIVNQMFCSVADPAGITSKEGEQYHIGKSSVSKILTKDDVFIPDEILEAVNRDYVRAKMPDYFNRYIIPNLGKDKLEIIKADLKELVYKEEHNSGHVSVSCEEIEEIDNFNSLSEILVKLFQQVMANESARKQERTRIKKLKNRPLKKEKMPEHPTLDESKYVKALFEVYSEKTGQEIMEEESLESYGSLENHFNRQRNDFYSAEYVRHICREIYSAEDEDPFDTLAQDIYDSIIDTYERDYPLGMDRLSSVLDKAVDVKHTGSILVDETKWIASSQKKGICHILVNDSKLDGWVGKKL